MLVGTLAFAGYQNPLGLRWPEATRTDDIDLAADDSIGVAVQRETTISEKLALLRKTWEPLFQVLAAENPPVSYPTPAGRIDFVTPWCGRQRDKRRKDLRQSALLFEAILADDPARAREAAREAARSGKKWKALLRRGLAELPDPIRKRLV